MNINNTTLILVIFLLAELSYLLYQLPRTSLKTKDRPILIDTSVLMDGRIIPIAATGFIGGTIVVPRSVVGELQFLADNADAEKRSRARQGLDAITELQKMPGVTFELLQDGSKANEGVDERLLNLAKRHNAVICTIDYNLNKVAAVEGITVLNVNELAQSIRMAHLPGEKMMLELVQKGQDSHQAVGYLGDGTMVVVEQSQSLLGQTVQIEVVRSLQTAAGKMMFAKRVDAKSTQKKADSGESQKPAGRKLPFISRSQQPRTESKPARTQQPNRAKKATSRDREASLLDLVNKQQ
ncbi:hypothetical protein H7Y29_02740 [Microbacteriaceae bacterium]|nr:hypothetical protein [Candidatus Saccharibacteria bacterium]